MFVRNESLCWQSGWWWWSVVTNKNQVDLLMSVVATCLVECWVRQKWGYHSISITSLFEVIDYFKNLFKYHTFERYLRLRASAVTSWDVCPWKDKKYDYAIIYRTTDDTIPSIYFDYTWVGNWSITTQKRGQNQHSWTCLTTWHASWEKCGTNRMHVR